MVTALWNLLFFVIALGALVTVHEFGHFWVARRCKVKVERFCIGFGKIVWQRTAQDGTNYALAAIPLGGYVKMLDSRVDEIASEDLWQAFDKKPLWQRSAVVAAGPFANFIFAIAAYWLVLILGVPALKPVVGEVAPSSIAAQASITPGMEIVAVGDVKTLDWEAVNMQMLAHIGDEALTLSVKPSAAAAHTLSKSLDLSHWTFDPEKEAAFYALGITPFSPKVTTTIAQVVEKEPADLAGLRAGDKVVAIDDEPIETWQQLVAKVQAHPKTQLKVAIEREQQLLTLTLVPRLNQTKDGSAQGFAGFTPQVEPWPEHYRFTLQYGVLEAIPAAVERTWQLMTLTLSMVKKLFTGDMALKNLSGPISIAKGAGMTADFGLVYFLGFLALISVNLGIMNLLPLPVLDGGHLLFFGIEAVARRPVPEKVQEMGYRLGSAIIVILMAVAIFNDFARL
ncbi:MAG: sigma E protease regulator RseP [Vibrionaceae bacterium]